MFAPIPPFQIECILLQSRAMSIRRLALAHRDSVQYKLLLGCRCRSCRFLKFGRLMNQENSENEVGTF